ncbi:MULTISPECIES: LCP family protein [Parafrankia]|uniref:LCP family protein n=1 Tax=Parafrankia TaxID=2994362 RepID=UPI001F61E7B6|nr:MULTISPECIES: LCP family protein [Parafrankia]
MSRLIPRGFLGSLSLLLLISIISGWADNQTDPYARANKLIEPLHLDLSHTHSSGLRDGATNYLIVGTDNQSGPEREHSETTILAHFGEDNTVTMLSFPGDTLVTIPEYTDSGGRQHPRHKGKLSSAISEGGRALLVRVIESLTKMRVDHYMSTDSAGFKAITDAVGGVDVCVLPSDYGERFKDDDGVWRTSTNTNDPITGWSGGPGTVHVNGDQALAFVHQRHGLPGGDIDRIHRQQQFTGAVLRKVIVGGMLANPNQLERLVHTTTSALTLDEKTTIMDLRGLATRVSRIGFAGIDMQTLPTHAPTRGEGAVNDRGEILVDGQPVAVRLYDLAGLEKILAPLGGSTGVVPSASNGGDADAMRPGPGPGPGPTISSPASPSTSPATPPATNHCTY